MRLSGYQPHYFPRLHYFARILDSDVFEISDYLQFVAKHAFQSADGTQKRGKSYQAHTIIKLNSGAFFLNVPTKKSQLPINRTEIEYSQSWIKDHTNTLTAAYGRAPYFKTVMPDISKILGKKYASLADLTITTIVWGILKIFDETVDTNDCTMARVNTRLQQNHEFRLKRVIRMSETDIPPAAEERDANDWIIETCKTLGCDEYYFGGTSATAYMDFAKYEKNGISLVQQNWTCREYPQQFVKQVGFVPNLSIIDLLMNVSSEEARKILM